MLKNNNDADSPHAPLKITNKSAMSNVSTRNLSSQKDINKFLESFFIAGVIIIIRLSANQGEEKLFKDASTKKSDLLLIPGAFTIGQITCVSQTNLR